jgi:D-amino-acid dehydrogenase
MSRSVVIVGGGLAGLSTALFLTERDAEVTILDHGALGGGAARGNAGFMNSTMINPLAGPGAILSAVKSFRDPARALRVHPMQVPKLAPWFIRFALACTAKKHASTSKALVDFNRPMHDAIATMRTAGVSVELGDELLCPFHDVAFAEKFAGEMSELATHIGLAPMQMLDGDEVRRLVPEITDHVRAGFVVPGDRMIDPRVFVDSMIDVLKNRGVRLVEHAPLTSVEHANGRVARVMSNGQAFTADEFLLTAGAGIRTVGKQFGLSIPVVAGQGYNVALPTSPGLTRPVIFEEAHAVATPFADRIRLGGTMEFGGENPAFDGRRVDAIIAGLGKFVRLDFTARKDTWAGCRPMSPDGKALLGRPKGWSNLSIAGGHGMYGLTLAPVTGRAMSELLLDGRSSTDLRPFDPNRFRL